MADSRTTVTVEADAKGFVSTMEQAGDSFKGFLSGLSQGNLAGIGEALSSIAGVAGPLLGVAGAGLAIHEAFSKVEEAVAATTAWNSEAVKLSRQLGITTQDASVLNETLKVMGVESSAYATAANFMTKALQTNSLGFKNLHIATRESDGSLRDTNDLMQEAIAKLNAMPDGTAKNIIGQQLFGRGWLANRDILKVTAEALEKTSHHMDELGTKVTPQSAAASREYKIAMNELHATFEAFSINLGNRLIPALTAIAEWLTGVGTEAVALFREGLDKLSSVAQQVAEDFAVLGLASTDLGNSLHGPGEETHFVANFFHSLSEAVHQCALALASFGAQISLVVLTGLDILVTALRGVKDAVFGIVGNIGNAVSAIASAKWDDPIGNLEKLRAAFHENDEKIKQDGDNARAAILQKEEAFWARMKVIRTQTSEGPEAPTPEEAKEMATRDKTKNKTKQGDVETKGQGDRLLKQWKEELDERKNLEVNWFTWSAAEELAFWEEKLSTQKKGSAGYKAALSEVVKFRKATISEERTAALTELKGEVAEAEKAGEARVQAIEKTEKKRLEVLKAAAIDEKAIAKNKTEVAQILDPDRSGAIELAALRDEKSAEDALAKETAALRAKDLADEKSALDEKLQLQKLYFETERSYARGDQKELARIRTDELKAVADTARAKAKLDENAEIEVEKALVAGKNRELALRLATNKQIAADQAKTSKQIEGYLQPFVTGFSNGIKKILDGSLSLADAVKGMGQMLVGAFTDMIGSIVQEWIASLAKMAAQWLAGLIFQESTQKTSEATRMATGAAARVAEAEGNAAVWATAAAASVAAIPFTGWAMAPGVFAAALALGQTAVPIAAAAGGFDIPAGMNPVTQLHAEEMVLPANLARAVRAMTDSGGGGGGGGGNSVTHVHNWSVNTMDAASFTQALRSNQSPLIKVLSELARDGKLRGMSR